MDLFSLSPAEVFALMTTAIEEHEPALYYALTKLAAVTSLDEKADCAERIFEELVLRRGLGL